jgi:hypothetical protein
MAAGMTQANEKEDTETVDLPQTSAPPSTLVFNEVRPAPNPSAHIDRRSENARMLRRLRWVAACGTVSFFLVVWALLETVSSPAKSGRDPRAVVREEISALERGDLQAAYAQLSLRYRAEIPFQTYHLLIASHRRVFLTRDYSVRTEEQRGGKTYIVADLQAENGLRYTAVFWLVRDGGRWWIDDLHWRAAARGFTRA